MVSRTFESLGEWNETSHNFESPEFCSVGGRRFAGSGGSRASWLAAETSPVRFAYAGYATSEEHGIQVFSVNGRRWTPTQTVASVSPAFLALDPTQRYLYAVNDKDTHEGLPTGTIEAYAIDAHDGGLTLINRQPLSLSGIRPRHLAVSPDGRSVVVAIDGGGAYNVLPIGEEDGWTRVGDREGDGFRAEPGASGRRASADGDVRYDRTACAERRYGQRPA